MKIIEATVYALKIPLRYTFGHFLKMHFYSDSIIVKLTADNGITGYGEGIARRYVTGETAQTCFETVQKDFLPALLKLDIPETLVCQDILNAISFLDPCFTKPVRNGVIAWNASKSAVELALIDCLLKSRNQSLGQVLPPLTSTVRYSGVITTGNITKTVGLAQQFKNAGFTYIKMKVGRKDDIERIAAVRDIMGPSVSIRVDANGAFSAQEGVRFAQAVEKYRIDSIEQPIRRGNVKQLAYVRNNSPVPVMADESVVTVQDAKTLIAERAVDYFNLRLSKCGGVFQTLYIADLCREAGIKVQLGCMVGETAVLSAAGRHLAAFIPGVNFIEGSYGSLLLAEDIAEEPIEFGNNGDASILTGNGLGIRVNQDVIEKYSIRKDIIRN